MRTRDSSVRASRHRRFGNLKYALGLALGVLALGVCSGAPITAVPGVSFEQRLGATLPLDTRLRDENGQATDLRNLLDRRPAVLVFGYSRCPQLCSVVANATVETLRALEATAGRDFSVVYVSIDPRDTSRDLAALKRRDVGRYGRTGVAGGWHYLGGTDRDLHRIADAAGFHYVYDERQKLYSHAAGFLVLTPDGQVSQYFLGVDFTAKDVAKALERAQSGQTGESVFNLLLVCARGLGISGKYGRIIWVGLEIAVSLTVLVVFGGIGWMFWQERKSGLAAVPDVEVRP